MNDISGFKFKPCVTKDGCIDYKLLLLIGIFVANLVALDTIAFKIIQLGPLTAPGGVFFFAITFLITDVTTEVWGKSISYRIVILGVVGLVVATIVYTVGVALPPAVFWKLQPEFSKIFLHVPRIMIASIVTFFSTEMFDVWAFQKVREWTKGRHLWIRNNVSTITSNFFNGIIFTTIAFTGVVPQSVLFNMIFAQVLLKWILALVDTPFCYLLVAWAKK